MISSPEEYQGNKKVGDVSEPHKKPLQTRHFVTDKTNTCRKQRYDYGENNQCFHCKSVLIKSSTSSVFNVLCVR